jgi:hypothetical protein
MNSFPTILDSSILATAKACKHKFFREYIENWKPVGMSVHLHAGQSFAAGVEAARLAFYVDGKPAEDSVAIGVGKLLETYGTFECPEDSPKSASRMAGALEFYFANYPLGEGVEPIILPSGKHGIEISFAEPLPILHPETNEPLIYCGRLDMAAKFAEGLFVEDDKTTSSLGATWSRQWDLRSQFTGYCWGLWKCAGIKPQGVLVRGVSILKTKYDTQQAITYRPDWMIEEWFENTCDFIKELVEDWKRGYWRKTLDHACTDFGGCAHRQPCAMKQPEDWYNAYFERRYWNPLTREETKL